LDLLHNHDEHLTHISLIIFHILYSYLFFFFNDPAPTDIYTLSLHDALPIWCTHVCFSPLIRERPAMSFDLKEIVAARLGENYELDRKSTRLNSSHLVISYAVFCLKKKKNKKKKLYKHRIIRNIITFIKCNEL